MIDGLHWWDIGHGHKNTLTSNFLTCNQLLYPLVLPLSYAPQTTSNPPFPHLWSSALCNKPCTIPSIPRASWSCRYNPPSVCKTILRALPFKHPDGFHTWTMELSVLLWWAREEPGQEAPSLQLRFPLAPFVFVERSLLSHNLMFPSLRGKARQACTTIHFVPQILSSYTAVIWQNT